MKSGWCGTGVRVVLVAAVVLSFLPIAGSQGDVGFRIVVNQANPVSSLTTQQLSRLFLKRDKSWSDGVGVKPVDLSADSPVRESFCTKVHGRPVGATKAYWQKLIFEGREVPPPEKASVEKVLDYVRANRGAIGYVGGAVSLGDGVKVIEIRS